MFYKKDYQAAFSKVTASEETYRRVMNMANQKKKYSGSGFTGKLLIAAVIVSMLALTAGAVEYVSSWLGIYFSQNTDKPLTGSQLAYLEENEQKICETQVKDNWTVELRSAIHDGSTAYIVIGITAPEGTDLEPEAVDGIRLETFNPGNGGVAGGSSGARDVVAWSKGILCPNVTYRWEEDGDGLENTKNYVIQIYPDMQGSLIDPFGSEAEYYVHLENIVREYEDEKYKQELLNGKYKDQEYVLFTDEETRRMNCTEVLVENTWDFTVHFPDKASLEAELLTEPVEIVAEIFRKVGLGVADYVYVEEPVTLTSFVLKPLTATICYAECNGNPSFTATENNMDRHVYVVMKDGNKIELLNYGSSGTRRVTLEAETPIVLEEVDYVLMGDGTKLVMPEL